VSHVTDARKVFFNATAGVVCDTPANIILDSTLTSSGIKLCPATQSTVHII
jgi:hypothetical protein